jgi:lathosterol oxidase
MDLKLINFTTIYGFCLGMFILSLFVLGRYSLTAVLYQGMSKLKKDWMVSDRPYKKNQIMWEILWSSLTSLIFGFLGALIGLFLQLGWTKIYFNWDEHSVIYNGISFIFALFFHDTYYYWLHRLMHVEPYYSLVHKTHHFSIRTTSWTSFSFHPFEAILQTLALFILWLTIPMHWILILIHLVFMTITSVINHGNWEWYPLWFQKFSLTKIWIGATHHSKHHHLYKGNYGLYFTLWDKWMKTELK